MQGLKPARDLLKLLVDLFQGLDIGQLLGFDLLKGLLGITRRNGERGPNIVGNITDGLVQISPLLLAGDSLGFLVLEDFLDSLTQVH